jgi:AbrB family looped-hinge helix DNA binding protein
LCPRMGIKLLCDLVESESHNYLPRYQRRMEMSAIVEADDKGRILIPAEIRRRFATKRFKVSAKGDRLELEPLLTIAELKGKYRTRIKGEWRDLEEKGEAFVAKNGR